MVEWGSLAKTIFIFIPQWYWFQLQYQSAAAPTAAKSHQSCLTLCDPIDGSPPGSPIPGNSPGKNTGAGCHFLLQCMPSRLSCVWFCAMPCGQQPTRLPHPWDSPGKNTGAGCHFLLQCMLSRLSRVWFCATPCGQQPTRLHCPWDSLGKSTGVGCHFFLPISV